MTQLDPPNAEFLALVEDAYEHLYDLVYLRGHPLAARLCSDQQSAKDRAWKLHHLLIDAIDELTPRVGTPPFSPEWRRHRLLTLRYVDGLDPTGVAAELDMGVRHYYRERKSALEAVAEILWRDWCVTPAREAAPPKPVERIELLRTEAARAGQAGQTVCLAEVIAGVLSVADELARERGITLVADTQDDSCSVCVDKVILRQILLSLLTELVARPEVGQIRLETIRRGEMVSLALCAFHAPGDAPERAPRSDRKLASSEPPAALIELATTQGIKLRPCPDAASTGYTLEFPAAAPRTVLIVDDNQDILTLFTRYLAQSPYRVVQARSVSEALDLVLSLQPFVITLDIMMPDRDGWEALQFFTNQPETRRIPVIVCTVLSVRELALSLGAAGFLEKPVSEQALLAALRALE